MRNLLNTTAPILAAAIMAFSFAPNQALAAPASSSASINVKALPVQPPKPYIESSFCSVAGVDRTSKGVAVYFTKGEQVTVTTSLDEQKSVFVYDPASAADNWIEGTGGPIMYLEIGSKFSMPTDGEGNCEGTVIRNSKGEVGVFMTADFTFGGVADSAEDWLSAQPTGLNITEVSGSGYEYYATWPAAVSEIPKLKQEFSKQNKKAQDAMKRMGEEYVQDVSNRAVEQHPLTSADTTKVVGNNDRFLSLLISSYLDTGGVHGMYGYGTILWDRKNNSESENLTGLFTDAMIGLRASYCSALDARRVEKSEGTWAPVSGEKYLDIWDCPEFKLLAIAPIGEKGKPFDRIRMIAAPYVAGPYSDGDYDISFPVTQKIIALIKPEYRSAFAVYQSQAKAN